MRVRATEQRRVADLTAHAAEERIRRAGLDVAAVDRALRLMATDPAAVEREEMAAASVLQAIGAGVEMAAVEVIVRTADEPMESHQARIRRRGYLAAVLNRPCDGGGYAVGSPEYALFAEGHAQFKADLRSYSRAERPKPRRVDEAA
jgi:hypothetical protein